MNVHTPSSPSSPTPLTPLTPSPPETLLDLDIAYTYFQSIRQTELHTAWSGLLAAAVAHRILTRSLPAAACPIDSKHVSLGSGSGSGGRNTRGERVPGGDGERMLLDSADEADTFLFASHLLDTEFVDVCGLLSPATRGAVAILAAGFAYPLLDPASSGRGGGRGVSCGQSREVASGVPNLCEVLDQAVGLEALDQSTSGGCAYVESIVDFGAEVLGVGRHSAQGWVADALTSGFDQPSVLMPLDAPDTQMTSAPSSSNRAMPIGHLHLPNPTNTSTPSSITSTQASTIVAPHADPDNHPQVNSIINTQITSPPHAQTVTIIPTTPSTAQPLSRAASQVTPTSNTAKPISQPTRQVISTPDTAKPPASTPTTWYKSGRKQPRKVTQSDKATPLASSALPRTSHEIPSSDDLHSSTHEPRIPEHPSSPLQPRKQVPSASQKYPSTSSAPSLENARTKNKKGSGLARSASAVDVPPPARRKRQRRGSVPVARS